MADGVIEHVELETKSGGSLGCVIHALKDPVLVGNASNPNLKPGWRRKRVSKVAALSQSKKRRAVIVHVVGDDSILKRKSRKRG